MKRQIDRQRERNESYLQYTFNTINKLYDNIGKFQIDGYKYKMLINIKKGF